MKLIICILLICVSCKKMVEVDPPADKISTEVVFENDITAIAALMGMYAQMIRTNQQLTSGATTIYAGLSADEIYNSNANATLDEFTQNGLSPANPLLRTNLWSPAYNVIYQANSILSGIPHSTGISPSIKKQLEGEAKFTRAFMHFYLLNIFGEVPLITSTDYYHTAKIPRTPVTDVYAQITNDLLDAKSLLSDVYQGAGRARVNKQAAAALLARVYLYRGLWSEAETESASVINAGTYSLVSNLNNVFIATSNETIWQIMPTSTTTNTPDGNSFIPAGTAMPAYPLSSTLLNAFAANDQRKASWTKSAVVSGTTYHYPFKYKIKTATTLTEYYVVLRLSEQFLIRAEARANQNRITEALADLNIVRARAGVGTATATNASEMKLLIEKERQLELFTEWGHRWFDLKRTGRADAVLGHKPGWQSTDVRYPIPFGEIQRNSALTQNPGY